MGRRTPLTEILLERIRREGPLTFAAFMQACLYQPQHGYYTRGRSAKGAGDYFTSPDVGPLFARLLARQFREMWESLGKPDQFQLVECGAGQGRLAGQLLTAVADHEPELARALESTLVEASASLRALAETALKDCRPPVHVQESLPTKVVGCMFSNELLDALPVHRVVQREGGLREIYISAEGDELHETEGPLSSPDIGRYLERYGAPLEEGQYAEVSLAALDWLEKAAAVLERGFMLTIDYGHRACELYGPGHRRGTLMGYRGHRAEENWLDAPGEQDLTAHVNFTALEERGRELGLEPLGYTTQASFLLALARACGVEELAAADQQGTRRQLIQLIHPEGMGETFKVLIQAKGVKAVRLSGLEPI
ncbi:MAG: SAM-dependent methyltransferase [Acidobacteria bacterium]|nr:SAM-dependent methyltransferase [Acidobacteriota bacterium]